MNRASVSALFGSDGSGSRPLWSSSGRPVKRSRPGTTGSAGMDEGDDDDGAAFLHRSASDSNLGSLMTFLPMASAADVVHCETTQQPLPPHGGGGGGGGGGGDGSRGPRDGNNTAFDDGGTGVGPTEPSQATDGPPSSAGLSASHASSPASASPSMETTTALFSSLGTADAPGSLGGPNVPHTTSSSGDLFFAIAGGSDAASATTTTTQAASTAFGAQQVHHQPGGVVAGLDTARTGSAPAANGASPLSTPTVSPFAVSAAASPVSHAVDGSGAAGSPMASIPEPQEAEAWFRSMCTLTMQLSCAVMDASCTTSLAVLRATCQDLRDKVATLVDTLVLTPNAMYKVRSLTLELYLVHQQLACMEAEAAWRASGQPLSPEVASSMIALVFVQQPYPRAIKAVNRGKRKVSVVTRLLKAHGATVHSPSGDTSCPAEVSMTIIQGKKRGTSILPAHRRTSARNPGISVVPTKVHLDLATMQCAAALTFHQGTNVDPAIVQFTTTVAITCGPECANVTLQTLNACPLVVTTNEKQWEDAEAKVHLRLLFGDSRHPYGVGSRSVSLDSTASHPTQRVPRIRALNMIQLFFMRATRQDHMHMDAVLSQDTFLFMPKPQRQMSSLDVAFLWQEKFPREHVTAREFDDFFAWFGGMCHHYRHNQGIREMYLSGMIFGMLSKPVSERLLASQRPGTFIVRNSQSSKKGIFCIAYLNERGRVRHCKIDTRKLQGPYGSLPDYLREKAQLLYIVKPFHVQNGRMIAQHVVLEKHEALQQYYSPTKDTLDDYYVLY